jgi:hypothetical protein
MKHTTIGIGVLSWRAHQTLINSLECYKENGFLSMFDEKVIYFSDMSDEDIAIAKEYGWSYAGGPNEGIAGGMKRLGENMKSDYILLLQNDNPIVEDSEFAIDHIRKAVSMLESRKADVVRLRHRWQVGEGFSDVRKYLKFFPAQNVSPHFIAEQNEVSSRDYPDSIIKKIKRTCRWLKAKRLRGRSIFVEDTPELLYPDVIRRDGEFLIVDSSIIHFTDQCVLLSRKMWLDVLMPYVDANPSSRLSNGFQAPEICINGSWWRNKHYKILQGRGVFSHARYDGSFRSHHPSNLLT